MSGEGDLGADVESTCEESDLPSALEATGERLKASGFFKESPPLLDTSGGFVVFEHGGCVGDEMGDVLLEGTGDAANDQTYFYVGLPLWKFQLGVESTAVVQAVTLLVHHAGLCLLFTSSNSKNIPMML